MIYINTYGVNMLHTDNYTIYISPTSSVNAFVDVPLHIFPQNGGFTKLCINNNEI